MYRYMGGAAAAWVRPRQGRRAVQRCALGVTLIELMVVVALLAILAALAAPGMARFATTRLVEDVARRLAEDMAMARNEAVKRNASVLLCADASLTSCNAPSTAAVWSKGWRVCFDANDDGSCDASSATDTNPVRVQPSISATVTLSGPLSRVRFNAQGTATASSFARFEVRGVSDTGPQWQVRFSASGVISVGKV
jgi:type IV fimbrial biogenesis protein FimT